MVPSRDGLLEMLKYEILKNIEFYKNFIIAEDDFIAQLEKYISFGNYGNDVVDLILYTASNTLGMVINVYELQTDCYVLNDMKHISPRDRNILGTIDVVRHCDHFNSIRFKDKGYNFLQQLFYSTTQ